MAVKTVAKFLSKKISTKFAFRSAALGVGTGIGAISGLSRAEPGLRKQGAKEGAIVGLTLGGAIAFSPALVRFAGRTIKTEAKRGFKLAKKTGKVVFRRIRGRIIPIRKK